MCDMSCRLICWILQLLLLLILHNCWNCFAGWTYAWHQATRVHTCSVCKVNATQPCTCIIQHSSTRTTCLHLCQQGLASLAT